MKRIKRKWKYRPRPSKKDVKIAKIGAEYDRLYAEERASLYTGGAE